MESEQFIWACWVFRLIPRYIYDIAQKYQRCCRSTPSCSSCAHLEASSSRSPSCWGCLHPTCIRFIMSCWIAAERVRVVVTTMPSLQRSRPLPSVPFSASTPDAHHLVVAVGTVAQSCPSRPMHSAAMIAVEEHQQCSSDRAPAVMNRHFNRPVMIVSYLSCSR